MARSTGPIIAAGAIVLANDVIANGRPLDAQEYKIIVGAAVAAGGLALVERVSAELAVGVAWVALVTVLFTRMKPGVPSPTESLLNWYNGK